MDSYPITPFVGVGPIKFGISRAAAHALLGSPNYSKKSRFAPEITDFWQGNGLQLVFLSNPDQLVEVTLNPNLPNVTLGDLRLFDRDGDEVFNELCQRDGDPMECVGVTVFLKLGLSASGFHFENDESKSVTAFAAGRWSSDDPDLKPRKGKN